MALTMTIERGTKRVREAAGKLPPLKGGRFLPKRRRAKPSAPPSPPRDGLGRHPAT
jgi:hypothetical protein